MAHEAGAAHARDPSGAEAFLSQAMADFTYGLRGVMEGLQNQHLHVPHLGLGDHGARALAAALANGAPLKTMDLTDNSLGPKGGALVAASLQHNTTLVNLVMR